MAENGFLSHSSASLRTASQVGKTTHTRYYPIIRGASHRSPVRRNALEVCPRVAIEPYALSVWSPLEMLNIPDVI